ncbi:dienelactone hydrolase family protein [uncultured Kiloniella sp.]|uniref:alpha/beta hydrolase n=1 Tax=uncultured Kiloniella sp. TaxID=1133091 RepID=UPI0026042371|nr:dienelactone hydrolase family protein [uncultured Kiloniella sp.]
MSEVTLTGPRHEPSSGGPAKELIIMLHGLGADGQDLIGLAPFFANALPHAAIVSPDAHQPCDMAPMGRQWFSLMSRDRDLILDGIQKAAPVVQAFIDQEMAHYNLPPERVFLMGFSQGAMMAYHVGFRQKSPFAGMMCYSGMLVAPDLLKDELSSKCPVLAIHGDKDEVVPPEALPAAVQAMTEHDITVYQEMISELGHGIDENGIRMGVGFVTELLGYAVKDE